MIKLGKTINSLCRPAYIYLVLSVIAIVLLLIQNNGNTNQYCVGNLQCDVPNTPLVFVAKILYCIFWVFVLTAICKAGYTKVSWFLVAMPFVLFFFALGILILLQPKNIEGLANKNCCDKNNKDKEKCPCDKPKDAKTV